MESQAASFPVRPLKNLLSAHSVVQHVSSSFHLSSYEDGYLNVVESQNPSCHYRGHHL